MITLAHHSALAKGVLFDHILPSFGHGRGDSVNRTLTGHALAIRQARQSVSRQIVIKPSRSDHPLPTTAHLPGGVFAVITPCLPWGIGLGKGGADLPCMPLARAGFSILDRVHNIHPAVAHPLHKKAETA